MKVFLILLGILIVLICIMQIKFNSQLNIVESLKNIETYYIFWTGGFDSTFLLCHWVISLGRRVQPIYIQSHLDNSLEGDYFRRNRKEELRARQKIIADIKKTFPHTRELLLPTIEVHQEPHDSEFKRKFDNMDLFRRTVNQYRFMAEWAKDFKKPISIGSVGINHQSTDQWGKYLWENLVPDPTDSKNHMDKNPDSPLSGLRFPLAFTTKKDILSVAQKERYDHILKLTWSCWFPKNGIPCGRCLMCQERIVSHP